jgi:NAD(P)-dependent dehydrogenase (short-subunit alcohol dehydrogenase family)
VGGVISLLGLCPPFVDPDCEEAELTLKISEWTFNLVKELEGDLEASAREGGGWFVNLTALGGRFGLGGEGPASLAAAGTLGIAKTLQRERPRLRVKNIDVDPQMPTALLAERLVQELEAGDDLVEVGLTRRGRWRPALVEVAAPRDLPPLPLTPESVVLVTGGAVGVTADVARGLAASGRPRLVLVGRSPLPAPEGPETSGLDRVALRRHFLQEARAQGQPVIPAEIERAVGRVLKDRTLRANLDACTAAGAVVEYHALDVRDAERFGELIDGIYQRFGRLDGVVHGAGVIEDKRIADKTSASFASVFRTKVDGALTLARKVRPEGLRFLVFFSSVSGRFGNVGQVDYSAANEFLNKLAGRLARRWPAARVVSINWGPWDGGMVSDELRRLYDMAGIGMIPVAKGVRAFLSEIGLEDRPGGEVVLSCSVGRLQAAGGRDPLLRVPARSAVEGQAK